MHSIDIGLALTAVLINGVFILLVLTRTSLTPALYVTFLLNCFAAMVWNFGDFMRFTTANEFGFWFYFSLLGTGIIPAVMFHFVNSLIGPAKNRPWIIVAYVLCSPLVLSSAFVWWRPQVRAFVDGSLWNVLYIMVLLPYFTAGVVILATAMKRAKSKNEMSRLRYILIAACIAAASGLTDLLQIFHVPVPPLGHLGSVIYSSVLAIGVFKHRAAYDLLAEMKSKLDMFNELSIGIAHELRNPLASIKGAASLLHNKSGKLTVEDSTRYLDLIAEEVERLDGILTNYQSLTRPLKIDKEPVQINSVIEKTVKLMQMNAEGPGIQLSLSPELPICESDPQSLKQVFINLIKNAQEACGPEDSLQITTECMPPWIKITFSDTGKGVPPDILPHIFEPFVSAKVNGMGLGLAICMRLIDLNGGSIEATNNQKGARFTIYLPTGRQAVSTP
jgi:signal transduction histidine kinase